MKGKTISRRWWEWAGVDKIWSWLAATAFSLAMIGLVVHLVGVGVWRTIGLWTLIGFDATLLSITFFRAKKYPGVWWWFSLFCYITLGVICWEIASYFFWG